MNGIRRLPALALVLFSCGQLCLSGTMDDTARIHVSSGWNVISIPVIVPDGRVSVLFPGAISPAYKYNGVYSTEDTLKPGVGYWMKFAQPDSVTLIGAHYTLEITLRPGWNLIGSPKDKVPFNHLLTDICEQLPSYGFRYKSGVGYIITDQTCPRQMNKKLQ